MYREQINPQAMKIEYVQGDYVIARTAYERRFLPQSVVGSKWDRAKKVWMLPKIQYPLFKAYAMEPADRDKLEQEFRQLLAKEQKVALLKQRFFYDKEGLQDDFLMRHQKLGLEISRVQEKYCYFYDTGTGKTIMALSIINEKKGKWVVVCPIVLILNAWMEDAAHFPELKCLPLSTNMSKVKYQELCDKYGVKYNNTTRKETLVERLKEVCDVFLINPESFHKFKEKVDGLVFDESVLLKNPTAKITKQIREFTQDLRHVYLLSGEPAPNTEEEFFSQISMVEPGLFGESVTRFRETFFVNLDPMGYKRILRHDKADDFINAINRVSTFVTKEQCLDLPEHTTKVYKFELSGPMMAKYKELERTAILEMQDLVGKDVNIQADLVLTKMMKARQFTGGFILTEGDVQFLHKEKLDTLEALLEHIGNKQVIIWISFHPEVQMITELLDKMGKTYVTAYGLTKDKDASVQDFKAGNADIIIAHPKTLKYGVTLTNCNYSIKYSMGHSYDDFKQSQDRIHRKGKTLPTTEYLIAAEGTIDEDIVHVAMGKRDKSDFIKELLHNRGGVTDEF